MGSSGGRPFQLLPGQGLGPFRLGQCLTEALEIVRQQPSTFRSCEVKYAQGKGRPRPDVALAFPELGFHLLFDGAQQRLRLVEVHDATRLQLSYGGRLLGGGRAPPRFGRICEELGPTFPGEPAGGLYPLQYPGLFFLFPLGPGAAGAAGQELPRPSMSSSIAGVEFPVALSTPVARILIHHGSAACLAAARAVPPPPLPAGSAYGEPVEALAGQGLLLGGCGACLRFGDSPQDVISEVGEPSSTHTKPGRPGAAGLTAPSSGAAVAAGAAGSPPGPPDYFFSYAERGIDVLFCGSSHRLTKLVLHANAPGHPDFGLYRKCNFRVHPGGSWSLPGSGGDGTGLAAGGLAWEGGNGGSPHARSSGSEGAGSMKTAASHDSLHALEPLQASPGGLSRQVQQQQVGMGTQRMAHSSLAAAGLAAVEHAGTSGDGSSPAQAGVAALLGRPPRPPTTLPEPAPQPTSSSSKGGMSKKKRKKERQRAAAAARLLGGGGGGGDESAADTDTSFADSAPSSLASSPGMTSFLSNIAATGGATGSRLAGPSGGGGGLAQGAEVRPPASGYSSDGGSHPSDFLAGKERRMECGSAFDGWSEAEDLALLVGGEDPAAPAASTAPADSAAERHALRCSIAVQTAHVDEAQLALDGLGELPGFAGGTAAAAAAAAGAGGSPQSPDSFVFADSPALFDEVVAAAEYEAVPHLRSCSTQTQPYHVPAGAQRRPASAASGSVRMRRPPGTTSAACVGVDGSLADIRAAFGSAAKPALHTRLGGRHPFGPTNLFAFQGTVFEITKNGAIATVTLFEA